MNESLVRHNSKFNFSPFFFFLQFRAPPSLFHFLHWSILPKLLIQGSSWWWSSFFHGLFLSGWHLLSPLLLCLLLHLQGGKSPLKVLIEAQRFNIHRSPTSKLSSHILPPFDDDNHYQVNSFQHSQNLHYSQCSLPLLASITFSYFIGRPRLIPIGR